MNLIAKSLLLYVEGLKTPIFRKKLTITLLLLIFFRLIAHIPVPGVNLALLKQFFSQNQLLSLLDIFSGGTLAKFSIAALGLSPYINASVMMQLLAQLSLKLKNFKKKENMVEPKSINIPELLLFHLPLSIVLVCLPFLDLKISLPLLPHSQLLA
jgi:preprotein translocase subunit SecY